MQIYSKEKSPYVTRSLYWGTKMRNCSLHSFVPLWIGLHCPDNENHWTQRNIYRMGLRRRKGSTIITQKHHKRDFILKPHKMAMIYLINLYKQPSKNNCCKEIKSPQTFICFHQQLLINILLNKETTFSNERWFFFFVGCLVGFVFLKCDWEKKYRGWNK